jgi:D-3-phosphoglycerate dehydrogenase / 2-oxoglutarate reductase
MGSLYTQHYPAQQGHLGAFDLIYEGELASMSSTKPLFAALIKGLVQPISGEETNINIVNAEMVAKERGIFVTEQKSRDPTAVLGGYSSLVTLVARSGGGSRAPSASRGSLVAESTKTATAKKEDRERVISGYCSDNTPFISRLDRFSTSFVPEGNMLICHNYDSPGKIGVVGSILGREEVNINFMGVAPASYGAPFSSSSGGAKLGEGGSASGATMEAVNQRLEGLRRTAAGFVSSGTHTPQTPKESTEALMILGVDREIGDAVVKQLIEAGGVLKVSQVVL